MSLLLNTQSKNAAPFYNGVTSSSLRANIGDSPGLRRTTLAGTSVRKFTFSAWVKRAGTLAATENLFQQTGDSEVTFGFRASGDGGGVQFVHYTGSTYNWRLETSAKLRDSTAWYHLVARVDTTQGTNTNRVRIYINGVVQTDLAQNTYPGQNFDTEIGEADLRMYLAGGKGDEGGGNVYNDSYITEINFIDGQSLAPTSFGVFKEGIWIPKDTAGITFGNNGTRLQFKNSGTALTSEATTATTNIGDDSSGNGHNFAVLGYVVSDVVPDNPENNFCNLSEVANVNGAALTEGCLLWTGNSGASRRVIGTHAPTSGKWYWEFKNTTGNRMSIGVANLNLNNLHQGTDGGALENEWAIQTDAKKLHNDNSGSPDGYGVAIGNGDLGMIAVNIDTNDIWFGREGAWFNTDGSSNTATVLGEIESGTNTNAVFTNVAGAISPVVVRKTGNNSAILNFGQDSSFAGTETAQNEADSEGFGDFYYAPPDGYLALCTVNLPEPTIGPNSDTQATDHFTTLLHTADGSAGAFTGADFQPDWIWAKNRTNNYSHELWDSNRGINSDLQSDNNNVEITDTGRLVSFDSGGFSYGTSSNLYVNNTASVAWLWKANGGTATATISESGNNPAAVVQANPTAGFSIITYTGTGAAGTIAHGLGVAPNNIIVFGRDISNTNPMVQDGIRGVSDPFTDYIAFGNANGVYADDATMWNDTAPTSSVFTLGSGANTNSDGKKYVAYLFASVEGYSKFGSYRGNGNANGAFVNLGFRPAFILIKCVNDASSWEMHDNKRDPINDVEEYILAESADAGADLANSFDFLSNGFKSRTTNAERNGTRVILYMAFAEASFKYANAR